MIILEGNPKKPESAEHHIVFPGGSISVCRTSDNEYWAHVKVNPEKPLDGAGEYESKTGFIRCIRIDTPDGVREVHPQGVDHFAVLISTKEPSTENLTGEAREQLKLF